MAQPDAANPTGGYEHAELAQFVAGTNLTMGREVSRVLSDSGLCRLVYAVLWVGLTPVLVQQGFDTTVFHGLL